MLAKAAKEKKPEEHKQKFMQAVTDLSKAFALAVPHEEAIEIRDDVGFFHALREVAVFPVDEKALALGGDILREKILPPAVLSDAIHASMAAIQRADILLTWNCRHLANPHLLPRMREFMTRHGLTLPEVCTPMELISIGE